MKATHQGHCQICGSVQKLPDGRLSKHGYTTKWGFFSGVCSGAGYLPFERDISLIEDKIKWAQGDAARLRKQADDEREKTDPEDVWYNMYFTANYDRRSKRGYHWAKTRIFITYPYPHAPDLGQLQYQHIGDDRPARAERLDIYDDGYERGNLKSAAKVLNGRYADHLEREAKKRDEYAKWQQDRIKDWKPQPLKPVK